jgi:hypothetical protein
MASPLSSRSAAPSHPRSPSLECNHQHLQIRLSQPHLPHAASPHHPVVRPCHTEVVKTEALMTTGPSRWRVAGPSENTHSLRWRPLHVTQPVAVRACRWLDSSDSRWQVAELAAGHETCLRDPPGSCQAGARPGASPLREPLSTSRGQRSDGHADGSGSRPLPEAALHWRLTAATRTTQRPPGRRRRPPTGPATGRLRSGELGKL